MDKLAGEGAYYTNAFTHSPVCAPSRGGMVTGCYPWTIGNHFMRCALNDPPRMFTHELVDKGYHVSWPTKQDFNFSPTEGWSTDMDPWWKLPVPEKPFFVYRNLIETHESRMFRDALPFDAERFPCPDSARHDPAKAPIPAYLPDTSQLRRQIANYYDALSAIDQQIGQCLDWLDRSGQRDNTIVMLLSDHGRGLPREKRWCYDAGLHLPLVIRWPGVIDPGTVEDKLVAWVDIAPTILDLLGVSIPPHYQGQIFLGPNSAPEREYIFAGRDRMDEVFDKQRVARNRQFHYIRNDAWWLPWAQRQWYMEQQPIMPVMRQLHAEGRLQGSAAVFFAREKPVEELFDVGNDPEMLVNLAGDPAYSKDLQALRSALESFLQQYGDLGETDERTLIEQGIVSDKLTEFAERLPRDDLPTGQIIGPRPIPSTLREAQAVRHAQRPDPREPRAP